MRLIILSIFMLSGCAGYTYTNTGDSCKVWIASGRAVENVDLQIDKDCGLTARAAGLRTDQTYLKMMDKLIGIAKPVN